MPAANRNLPSVVFVVEESVPQASQGSAVSFADPYAFEYLRPPFRSWKPIRAFGSKEAAEDYCRELEAQEWEQHNPFTWGERLSDITSLDEPRLRDWLLDAGLTPPEDGPPGNVPEGIEPAIWVWIGWWEQTATTMTPLQRKSVFDAADRVRLFRVSALTL